MLDALAVPIVQASDDVGGIAVRRRVVAAGDPQVGAPTPARRERRVQPLVPIGVVERKDAIGEMAIALQCPRDVADAAVPPEREPLGAIVPRADFHARPRPGAPAGEELNDAGDRLRAIQHAGGAAHDLDAFDRIERDAPEVKDAARLVDGHAVHEHAHVIRLPATQEERDLRARTLRARHREARDTPQRIGHVRDPLRAQRRAVENGRGRGGRDPDPGEARRGHDRSRELRGITGGLRGERERLQREERDERQEAHGMGERLNVEGGMLGCLTR